jgi:hypothetical protein
MICFAIPFFIGYVLVAISASIDSVIVLYIGRFVAGTQILHIAGVNFTNILRAAFLYESFARSFFVHTF